MCVVVLRLSAPFGSRRYAAPTIGVPKSDPNLWNYPFAAGIRDYPQILEGNLETLNPTNPKPCHGIIERAFAQRYACANF